MISSLQSFSSFQNLVTESFHYYTGTSILEKDATDKFSYQKNFVPLSALVVEEAESNPALDQPKTETTTIQQNQQETTESSSSLSSSSSSFDTPTTSSLSKSTTTSLKKRQPQQKQNLSVHFLVDANDDSILPTIHTIEPIPLEYKNDVYMSSAEIKMIRRITIQTARTVYLACPDLIELFHAMERECCLVVVNNNNTTKKYYGGVSNDDMKSQAWAGSTGRGLERVLSKPLMECGQTAVQAIVQKQDRATYLQHSARAKHWAWLIAQGDAKYVASTITTTTTTTTTTKLLSSQPKDDDNNSSSDLVDIVSFNNNNIVNNNNNNSGNYYVKWLSWVYP